jgi:hypothetical protein
MGPGAASWVRRCAIRRTVPGSIPGGVTGFVSDIFLPTVPWPWGSTKPPVKMSTKNIPGGKGGRCVRVTSLPSRAECHEIWEPKPLGTLWATPGLLREPFTFTGIDYGSGVELTSKRNEYQGYLLVGKDGRCVGLTTLPPSCADCLQILGASTS